MNSKTVLSKIMSLLNIEDTISLTDARTADGTILQSPTFDLGEKVEVVSEDGTKTPAPDGEHQIALKDSEGNEVIIRVITKDGIITERENVEEAQPEAETEMETVKVEDIPQASGDLLKVNETPTQKNSVESGTLKMAEQTDTAEPITEDENAPTEEMPTEEVDMGKLVEDMAYRIGEMEAKIAKMEETMYPPVNSEVTEEVAGVKMAEVDEEELPKLDGAPVEQATKFASQTQNNYGKKVNDSQSNFLSKLYN
jgi:hypothetical protein